MFLLVEAKTFIEFSDCFYIWATGICTLFNFISNIERREQIFQLIDNFEDVILKRKQMIKNILFQDFV